MIFLNWLMSLHPTRPEGRIIRNQVRKLQVEALEDRMAPAIAVASYQAEGNYIDAVGGNHGQAPRLDVQFVPGHTGQAFRFTSDGYYFRVANNAMLEPQQISVEAWVRGDPQSRPPLYSTILGKGREEGHASYALYTGETGGLEFYINNANATFHSPPVAPSAIWNGEWHHVVGTYYLGR